VAAPKDSVAAAQPGSASDARGGCWQELAERFVELGFREFVFPEPDLADWPMFELVTRSVIPAFRQSIVASPQSAAKLTSASAQRQRLATDPLGSPSYNAMTILEKWRFEPSVVVVILAVMLDRLADSEHVTVKMLHVHLAYTPGFVQRRSDYLLIAPDPVMRPVPFTNAPVHLRFSSRFHLPLGRR
jgi:hypothetical protein